MFPYAWQLVSLIVSLIPVVGGMFVAINYRRLSPHIPLIAVGFGLVALLHVVSSGVQAMLMNRMIYQHTSASSYGVMMGVSSGMTMAFSLGAWALVLIGLSLTLRDLQSRLQGGGYFNNLNGAASSNTSTRDVRLSDASAVYHQQAANYSPPTYYQPAREETHATDFALPPAPAVTHNTPSLPNGGAAVEPVRTVAVDQPEHAVTLGSAVQ